MKTMTERIRTRLSKDRKSVTVTIRLPEDVIEDLTEIAPTLGFSGYRPLIRSYVGQGLRKDLEKLHESKVQLLTESLRRKGLPDEDISEVIAESGLQVA